MSIDRDIFEIDRESLEMIGGGTIGSISIFAGLSSSIMQYPLINITGIFYIYPADIVTTICVSIAITGFLRAIRKSDKNKNNDRK